MCLAVLSDDWSSFSLCSAVLLDGWSSAGFCSAILYRTAWLVFSRIVCRPFCFLISVLVLACNISVRCSIISGVALVCVQ